jgi:hypothetical protein
METKIDAISKFVFNKVQKTDTGEFSLDGNSLKVYLELDGMLSLEEISQKLGMEMEAVGRAMIYLVRNKMVARVASGTQQDVLSPAIMADLMAALSTATGPIAGELLADVLAEMGHSRNNIPESRGPELLESLAEIIPDKQRRLIFVGTMIPKLQAK